MGEREGEWEAVEHCSRLFPAAHHEPCPLTRSPILTRSPTPSPRALPPNFSSAVLVSLCGSGLLPPPPYPPTFPTLLCVCAQAWSGTVRMGGAESEGSRSRSPSPGESTASTRSAH